MRAISLFSVPKGIGLLPGPIVRGEAFNVAPAHESIARKLAEFGALSIVGESTAVEQTEASTAVEQTDAPDPRWRQRPLAPCVHCGQSYVEHTRARFSTDASKICGGLRRGFVRSGDK